MTKPHLKPPSLFPPSKANIKSQTPHPQTKSKKAKENREMQEKERKERKETLPT
jgi:hypothetical protein